MDTRAGSGRLVAELAARARIEELRERSRRMTIDERATSDAKAETRAMWALGDYHRFARETVWEVGERLVGACRVRPGQRVLDVAAGSGNVAIRAAEAGASVVASDLTPENFDAGRREAAARGVELEWVAADAEALPFRDAEFDVVTSSFGAMFAPDQRAVADELVRVCRPGGTIGLASFTPDGLAGEFFGLFGAYAPAPPPDFVPPVMWGDEAHVAGLFADRVQLEASRRVVTERLAGSPADYVAFYKQTFGPVVGIYASIAGDSVRTAALDRDFLAFAERANEGPPTGPVEYAYEYLEVVARRA